MSNIKTFAVAKDTGLMSPAYGNGAGTTMWAAYDTVQTRMVLEFTPDWTDVNTIVSAVLSIRSGSLFTYHTPKVIIRRCTSSWTEGSYNGGDSGAGNQGAGVEYPGPSVTNTDMVTWSPGTSHNSWGTVDITNIVKAWAPSATCDGGGDQPNYGISIRQYIEGIHNYTWDAKTRESGYGAYITITYNTYTPDTPEAPTTLQELTIDLDNGKRGGEISRVSIFDTRDINWILFSGASPSRLPWGNYRLEVTISGAVYNATSDDINIRAYPDRCHNCTPSTGETFSTNKYSYLDSIIAHEEVALATSFTNEPHLSILESVANAVQVESCVTENGLSFVPRVGQDTDIILREGQNTVVGWNIVNDFSGMASILYSAGSDINGLPLFTITQDSKNKRILGRNVSRQQDFRELGDYTQLIGVSRTELKNRRIPSKRVSISHIAKTLDLIPGDSFILYSVRMGPVRLRINRLAIKESSSNGRTYELECEKWQTSMAPYRITTDTY